eukprot:5918755-Pyramimonas_sp.AAC.1
MFRLGRIGDMPPPPGPQGAQQREGRGRGPGGAETDQRSLALGTLLWQWLDKRWPGPGQPTGGALIGRPRKPAPETQEISKQCEARGNTMAGLGRDTQSYPMSCSKQKRSLHRI